jgi:hypothetical protein
MNIEKNIITVLEKNLKNVLERKPAHLAFLYDLIAFLKTLQSLNEEWQKSPALGPGKQTEKNLVWFGEIEKNLAKL